MKHIIPALITAAMLALLASCSLGGNLSGNVSETETADASLTEDITDESSDGAETGESEAVTYPELTINFDKETSVPPTEATATTAPTTAATKPSTTGTTAAKPTSTTAKPATTAKPVTTTAKPTTTAINYEGETKIQSETYRENLKYGVYRSVNAKVIYAVNDDGSLKKLGNQSESSTYVRFNYSASYSDLLPAAKQNAAAYEGYINEVLRLTNEMRAKEGLAPLKLNSKLTEQANVRAEEIAWSGQHSHTRPGYKYFTTIFRENGLDSGTAGENIGWGYSTPDQVCKAWKNSETHYENIMNGKYKSIGIGVAPDCDPDKKLCWVQHFYSE